MNRNDKEKIFKDEILPHADALLTFGYHLTGYDSSAEDLVQITLEKAWRNIERYELGTNAKAWLFTIMRNAFINDYRKKSKQPTVIDIDEAIINTDEDNNGPLSSYVDLREEMLENLMGDEITEAINSLAIDNRTAILLCDVEGFTYEEIAKITSVPVGTVRSRLFRARNQLKTKLKEYAENLGYKDNRTSS